MIKELFHLSKNTIKNYNKRTLPFWLLINIFSLTPILFLYYFYKTNIDLTFEVKISIAIIVIILFMIFLFINLIHLFSRNHLLIPPIINKNDKHNFNIFFQSKNEKELNDIMEFLKYKSHNKHHLIAYYICKKYRKQKKTL